MVLKGKKSTPFLMGALRTYSTSYIVSKIRPFTRRIHALYEEVDCDKSGW